MKRDEIVLEKNVDRLIAIAGTPDYLAATYHLDKETQTKTGSLVKLSVVDTKITVNQNYNLDYGVLSLKQEGEDLYSVGCSDGAVRLLSLDRVSKTYETDDSSVCLMHDTDKTTIAACYSSGSVFNIDRETG